MLVLVCVVIRGDGCVCAWGVGGWVGLLWVKSNSIPQGVQQDNSVESCNKKPLTIYITTIKIKNIYRCINYRTNIFV